MCTVCVALCSDETGKSQSFINKFHDYQRKAEMYYVYHSIQRFTVCTRSVAVIF